MRSGIECRVAGNCVVSPQQRTRNGRDGREMMDDGCGEEAGAEWGQIAPSGSGGAYKPKREVENKIKIEGMGRPLKTGVVDV